MRNSHMKAPPGTVSWTQCHSQGFVRTDGGVEAKGRVASGCSSPLSSEILVCAEKELLSVGFKTAQGRNWAAGEAPCTRRSTPRPVSVHVLSWVVLGSVWSPPLQEQAPTTPLPYVRGLVGSACMGAAVPALRKTS